jgi:hypothetical protein
MSDHQSLIEQQHIPADDGWDDAAAEAGERIIRGQLLKFADWRWTIGKEATPVENGTRLVALATAAMWVRWEDGKPVEYRVRQPGQRLPEREALGFTDVTKWEIGPGGEPKDPWANTRLVYLVDPDTAEAYTFSTSSLGGRAAVIELGDQIARMRATHPDAAPIVELRAAEMPTRFGRKSKPALKVVGWKNANARPTETAKPVERIRPIITSGRQALASPEPPPSATPVEVYDGPDAIDDSIP